jgi:hypothetical protein
MCQVRPEKSEARDIHQGARKAVYEPGYCFINKSWPVSFELRFIPLRVSRPNVQ